MDPRPEGAPRAPTKITARTLAAMQPGERVWDAAVRGLYAEAGARGVSLKVKGDLWRGGALVGTRGKTLGRWPGVQLDRVRAAAMTWLGDLRAGKDPSAPVVASAAVWTVREAVAGYLEDMATRECAELTIRYARERLEGHLSAWLGLPLDAILPSMCQAEHKRLTVEAGKVAANKTLRDFRAVYNFARRKIDDPDALRGNPVESVTFHPERRREAVIHPDDVAAWLRKARALTNPLRAAMHELGLFSGLRPGNLVAIRREWIDAERGLIVFPAGTMKGRRAFVLPLSEHMAGLVCRALQVGEALYPGAPWLFPTRSADGRTVKPTQVWKEKTMAGETGHILRHTWRTLATAAGLQDTDAELLMAHAIPGVKGVYVHDGPLLEHLRAQQERVTAHILRIAAR